MKRAFFIDHHIQTSILSMLLHEGSQTFSKIKPDDIENSLFMYHMRKLVSRGLVERQTDGYGLTAEGARWLNKTGLDSRPIEEPRCLIQFLAVSNGNVLISERVDHLAVHMNRYLLPGGLHRFGMTSQESAEQAASSLGLALPAELICRIETIVESQHHHAIIDLYRAALPDDYRFSDDFYTVRPMPVGEVLAMSEDDAGALPLIVQKYTEGSLSSRLDVRL